MLWRITYTETIGEFAPDTSITSPQTVMVPQKSIIMEPCGIGDNVCVHTAAILRTCLAAIDTVPWPTLSIDMSSKENLGNAIVHSVKVPLLLQNLQNLSTWDELRRHR
ncbi:hypothetical protein TNCV_678321 [Trichonephila clavipes]|nr:hypothetical protein TNCV_678321 [Trichonephila clavipes]